MTRSIPTFEPDLLLGSFASGLACRCLSPLIVNALLQTQGEPGKVTIEEYFSALGKQLPTILRVLGKELEIELEYDERGPPLLHSIAFYEFLQEQMKTPTFKRVLWTSALQGQCKIDTSLDPRIARELLNLIATENLVRLDNPSINVPSLDYAKKCLMDSVKKAPHRPVSSENEMRFRTSAVAAALFFRETGASPRSAWKWAAERLNRDGSPNGRRFKAKTIENWSSKGMYSESLLRGMKALAHAPYFSCRTPPQVAEVALLTALHFMGLATKNAFSLPGVGDVTGAA
jgi:hypothetical protein